MGLRWPALLPYLFTKSRRAAADRAAADDVNWRHHPGELPRGLEIQWLGTAGFRLTYEGVTVVTDPYLTRATFNQVAFRKTLAPDPALVEKLLPKVDAVVVGHTHFDHVVDVPVLAQRGATVYGSQSVQHLLGLYGLQDKAVVAEPYQVYEVGPFRITFVPSVHSKLVLGLKVPYEGEITCEHLEGLTGPNYKCGQVWGIHIEVAGTSFYHQGSCNLIDDAVKHSNIDVFLAGIAGRGFTERYWERILGKLEPRLVVAHHHDNFFLPLEGEMGFSFNVNFGAFLEEVQAVSKDFGLRVMDPLQTISGGA